MKAIILAGGYGRRLKPFIDFPKALIDVGGKPILTYILQNACKTEEVESIIISTNEYFRLNFESYLQQSTWHKPVQLVVEPSNNEGHKLGSVGGIQFVISKLSLSEDLLIIGGDNLFEMDLSLFLKNSKNKAVIAVYNVGDRELASNYGVVTTDEIGRITDFKEKPEQPASTLVSTAIYRFPKKFLPRINEYLSEGGSKDRLGDFISWVCKRDVVYAFEFSKCWFDVGTFVSLKAAIEHLAAPSKTI
jgi:glucose-1-phosphate thymidylyltransferase